MRATQSQPLEVIGCVEDDVFRILPKGDLDSVTAASLLSALQRAEATDLMMIRGGSEVQRLLQMAQLDQSLPLI